MMQPLDAKFYGILHKVKDGTLLAPDEFVVFLAKDNAFAEILPMYRDKCIELGADDEQIASVDRMINRLNAWRAANPHRLKVPDAKGEKLAG